MFHTIEEALEDLKCGKLIVVVDNEKRENEGDLIGVAENITYDSINFMTKEGRGLICVPMCEKRGRELNFSQMVHNNTDAHGTAFTVSVDSLEGTTTGISVSDRLKTIKDIAVFAKHESEFRRPGHIFPLIAKKNGVLEREGHTEAAVDLAKLAGFAPIGVICEILKEDGEMARVPDLVGYCEKHNLKMITIEALVEYRKRVELQTVIAAEAVLPTKYGDFRIIGFENPYDKKEHVALVKGDVFGKENVLTRVHSECLTGDVLGSLKCDCGGQLDEALSKINQHGSGILLYLRQEGRGIGLINKIRAYKLQQEGADTVDANLELGFEEDLRDYYIASQMLKALGVKSVELMTNNHRKINGLKKYGVQVSNRISIEQESNDINYKYLKTKKERLNHMLKLEKK
ncbi:MAG: bifunctional 3,4-dihydroxy-2-butanone-4-phosphate synthase/GTP cyclohydrolase II [Fusobacteriaceae bacterium]|nr:bifunctional 3,4-dihydroxy-2-butanone-4-phosphate synthase/GTP cyclohydrolase II [Fusobacteriaceae bacterium]MBP6322368.1 bifunctional 3,4-dihydroxy-2-butanone-4-phosphate synthase/GTP cyclohydrolase II [Fusobacteriaceae bacterium]MBP9509933.1 bifunctional 3,4-dihydroxy-2-butanone-4-phosphate synthase/GTP cyclohydrolase II [Fusobacteriaceae bacterium]